MSEHKIGTTDDFPTGKGAKVEVDGISIAVFNIRGELYGIQDYCPHKYMPLHIIGHERYFSQKLTDEGFYNASEETCADIDVRGRINADELSVLCPYHQLEWELESGENSATDMQIATYDIDVKADDTVWVEL